MRCVLVDPGSLRSYPIIHMLCTSSDMAAVNPIPLTQGVSSHSDVGDSKATSPPSPEDATVDMSPKPQWLEEDTSPADDVVDVPVLDPSSQDDTLEEGIPQLYYALPSLGSLGFDFEPHRDTQTPSALQGERSPIHESQSFTSEYSHDLAASVTSESNTPIKEEGFDPDDLTLGLFHPVPRYIFSTAGRNIPLFPDKVGCEATPLFTNCEVPQEDLFDHGIVPKIEWTLDDFGTVPFLDEPSLGGLDTIDDTGIPTMNQTCSPESSLSWSPAGYQASSDMQHQGINHNHLFCPSGRDVLNTNDQDYQAGTWFDQTAAASDPRTSAPLSNVSHSYLQQPVPLNPCRPNYTNLTTSQDTTTMNRDHGIFRVTEETFAYHESLFRLNQLTQSRLALDTSHHLRQLVLGNRTFTCPLEARNAFLINSKRLGLSYKDIKRLGEFPEAESTLRGRYRTLTKSKEQRVRKPHWHDKDVSCFRTNLNQELMPSQIKLLCEAVNTYSETGKKCCHHSRKPNRRPRALTGSPRIPWKKVAQYIMTHGGSYHFGNATCKKKWCEVHGVRF